MILACKLGGSPSLLWFRAPGRDRLGDNGKKTLLLCLLCSLQTSPWSVGPWLIPTAISKRRHKMSLLFSWQGWKTKECHKSPFPHTHQRSWRNRHKILLSKCLYRRRLWPYKCFRKVVDDLSCWALRMSNFYHEIKCGEEENPSTLNRDLKMCTLAEGVGPRTGWSCWGSELIPMLREVTGDFTKGTSWAVYSSIHLTDTWLVDILPSSVAHQQDWFRIKKHFCTAVRSCD